MHCLTSLLFATFCTAAVAAPTPPAPNLAVVPWPKEIQAGTGAMPITAATRIVFSDAALEAHAKVFAEEIRRIAAADVKTTAGKAAGKNGILLVIDPSLKKPYDEYSLTVAADNTIIKGGTMMAVSRGTATFLQLIAPGGKSGPASAKAVRIHDWAALEFSGLMADLGRRYHSMNYLKQYVDICRYYKMRFLHLHINDDEGMSFPFKAFPVKPVPARDGNTPADVWPYPVEQWLDLVKYADERGVYILPELEAMGHSRALNWVAIQALGYKNEKGEWAEMGSVVNVANPECYPALEKMIGEFCAVFKSSPIIHLGGDEIYMPNFKNNPVGQEYMKKTGWSENRIIAEHYNKLGAMVKKHGRTPMAWDGFSDDPVVDKEIVILNWTTGGMPYLQKGHKVFRHSGNPGVWAEPEVQYAYDVWHDSCILGITPPAERHPLVGGAQMAVWELAGVEQLVRLFRFRAQPRHERIHSPDSPTPYEHFKKRFELADLNYERMVQPFWVEGKGFSTLYGAPMDDAMVTYTGHRLFDEQLTLKVTSMRTCPGEVIRYTLDGTEPTGKSPQYTQPITLTAKDGAERMVDHTNLRVTLVSLGMFKGDELTSGIRQLPYYYNAQGQLAKGAKMTVYEVPDKTDALPKADEVAKLKVLCTTYVPGISARNIPWVRFPGYGFLSSYIEWEGTFVVRNPNARIMGFEGGLKNEFLVDGKPYSDKVPLAKGTHTFLVRYVGQPANYTILWWNPEGGGPRQMDFVEPEADISYQPIPAAQQKPGAPAKDLTTWKFH